MLLLLNKQKKNNALLSKRDALRTLQLKSRQILPGILLLYKKKQRFIAASPHGYYFSGLILYLMSVYYLHDGRNESGPYTIDLLKKQKLTRNTPIRIEGTDNWMPAEKLPGLKEWLVPQKIRQPKDVVPVLVERVTEFKQRRPKAAYGLLLGLALLAGISIYSIGGGRAKKLSNELPKAAVALAPQPTDKASLPAGVSEKKEAVNETPKNDKEKTARLQWNKLFSATNSNYGIGFLGGIKDLKIIFTNRSDYPVDEVVAKVTYIKASGGVWKTKLISIYSIPAHDDKEQSVPDVNRGKKVTVSLQKIVSKKMKFTYTAVKKTGTAEDPYLMQ